MDLIGIHKDSETIIDAFSVFEVDIKGVIDEDELRSMLGKYVLILKVRKSKKFLKNQMSLQMVNLIIKLLSDVEVTQ